jgi:uncharacterized protein (UPF0128 family)
MNKAKEEYYNEIRKTITKSKVICRLKSQNYVKYLEKQLKEKDEEIEELKKKNSHLLNNILALDQG